MRCVQRILVVVGLIVATATPAFGQKLVYLVRHAERADGGAGAATSAAAGSMTAPADPLLSPAGETRAARLAAMLADAGITAIYVTEFRRTQHTGQPLAAKLGLTLQTVPSRDTETLVKRIRASHSNEVVLVIGHSNSVPGVIKALGGPDLTITDQEYDNLFVFVPATGVVSRIRY